MLERRRWTGPQLRNRTKDGRESRFNVRFKERGLVKRISAHGGCLGTDRRRRTWQAAISPGELQASRDPGVSEWGNPAGANPVTLSREPTQGTETSKYLEEKKSIEIPRVAASEKGRAQTRAG